jgi:DNA-binding response OmpR family regulator
MTSATVARRILIVEDDEDFRETLQYALSSANRSVSGVSSAGDFREKAAQESFDLAIVDINLPDDSGFAVVRFLRETSNTKIIVLTGRDTITDRVEGYTHGAHIYMVKPTSQAELLAAVDSLLREEAVREGGSSGWRLSRDDGSLHAPDGARVVLSIRQMDFMNRLMSTPQKAVKRDELRRVIGIEETDESGRALDMFVTRLRREIEEQVSFKAPIETVPRQGFAFRRL